MLHCFRGMDASDSTYYSNLVIKSINLQIKSRPSLKGKTHLLNEKTKSIPVFEGQKMVKLEEMNFLCVFLEITVST